MLNKRKSRKPLVAASQQLGPQFSAAKFALQSQIYWARPDRQPSRRFPVDESTPNKWPVLTSCLIDEQDVRRPKVRPDGPQLGEANGRCTARLGYLITLN